MDGFDHRDTARVSGSWGFQLCAFGDVATPVLHSNRIEYTHARYAMPKADTNSRLPNRLTVKLFFVLFISVFSQKLGNVIDVCKI